MVVGVLVSCGPSATLSARLQAGPAGSGHQPLVGQSSVTSLSSLQYSIREISICEGLETSGTGFNQPQACLTIFTRPSDERFEYRDPTQDFSGMAAIARGTSEHFVDLVDATSRASLSTTTTLGAQDAHAYNWGLITWDLPIKVRADISMSDGTTLHTHDGETHSHAAMGGGFTYQTVASAAFDTGVAETATLMLPNGGTWFRFQHPLTVTAEDLSAATALSLDLAFDPEGLVTASTGARDPGLAPLVDGANRALSVPLLDVSPIPHRATESVVRETWLAHVTGSSAMGGTDAFDLRLELYTVAEDPARTIYGVGVATVITAQTQRLMMSMPRVSFISGTDALDFEDWSHSALISGFTRSGAVGAQAGATLHCGGTSLRFAGCGDDGRPATTAVTFTLDTVTPL